VRAQRGELDAPPADLEWMAAAVGDKKSLSGLPGLETEAAAAEEADCFMVQEGMTLRERTELVRAKYEQRRFMSFAVRAAAVAKGALAAAARCGDVVGTLRLLAAGANVDGVVEESSEGEGHAGAEAGLAGAEKAAGETGAQEEEEEEEEEEGRGGSTGGGDTALHVACTTGAAVVAQALLLNGADASRPDE